MPIVIFAGSLAEVVEPPPAATLLYGRAHGDVQHARGHGADLNPAVGATGGVGDTHGHGTGDGSTGRTGGSGTPHGRRGRVN